MDKIGQKNGKEKVTFNVFLHPTPHPSRLESLRPKLESLSLGLKESWGETWTTTPQNSSGLTMGISGEWTWPKIGLGNLGSLGIFGEYSHKIHHCLFMY